MQHWTESFDSARDNHWKCEKCTNTHQNRTSESTHRQLPGSTKLSPSQPVPTTLRNKLKIYEWNADGIQQKFIALFECLLNGKLTKLHSLKVTLQSEKIETTSLEAVFYSSSKQTSCSRNYTLSKKLAGRSCPFISRLLNQLGLNSTMYIYQTPQLNIIHSTLL